MPVWTVSAQKGVGGHLIASDLAGQAGVSLYDRSALIACALEHGLDATVGDDSALAARITGRLHNAVMGVGATLAVTGALEELGLRETLLAHRARLISEAAREPAVILATAGFAVLRDHPGAINARICAPIDWRVTMYARRHLLDIRAARRLVRLHDRRQHALVRALAGGADIDDPRNYGLVIDARRVGREPLVTALLAAGLEGAPFHPPELMY